MSDGLNDLLAALGGDPAAAPDGSAGGALRKQLEAVLAQNKELTDRLAAQEATNRESQLNSLFGKHGVPELARDFFPKDGALTDESVTGFVEKYGQLWGATATPATTDPAQQAAANASQAFTSQAHTVSAPQSEEEYAAQFSQAKTKGDLLRMIAEAEAAMSAAGA